MKLKACLEARKMDINKVQKLNKGLDLVVQEEDICRIKDLVYYDTLFYKEALSIFENQCASV